MTDPIRTRDRVKIAGTPYAVQLDRPDCPSLVIGCEHQRGLRTTPSGIWGTNVRLTTKPNPQSAGDIAGRSWDGSKTIGLDIQSWVNGCSCHHDECAEFHDITAAFRALDKVDATLTYTDAKGRPYRFRGRPNGSSVRETSPECVNVRAAFLAVDPVGYGPLRKCEIEITPGAEPERLRLWNHGSIPIRWWFTSSNPSAFGGGPVVWSIGYGEPIPGTPRLQTTFSSAASKQEPVPLTKGRNDLLLVTEPVEPSTITVCYREGWV